MRTLFAEFTVTVEKKIEVVLQEPLVNIIVGAVVTSVDINYLL